MKRAAALVLTAFACGASAATLDASPSGADIVFTWDTPTSETILRGTTPDSLVPWMVGATSPATASGENLTRSENAFYRLASGSNLAWRIEMRFDPDLRSAGYAWPCLSLPERRSYDAMQLFTLWPDLLELKWWDAGLQRWNWLGRFGADVIGDTAPLPRHGGVGAMVRRPSAMTIVGSHDDAYAGPDLADIGSSPYSPLGSTAILGNPPHSLRERLIDILCGEQGVDWNDLNGDAAPDTCGRDTDADGFTDTGMARTPFTTSGALVVAYQSGTDFRQDATAALVLGQMQYMGNSRWNTVPPGLALQILTSRDPVPMLNLPFRPPLR